MPTFEFDQLARWATVLSSVALRVGAWVFLRWVPGHRCPPGIYALLAAYIPSFLYSLFHTQPYEIIADELDIFAKPVPEHNENVTDVDPRYTNGDVVKEPLEELDVEETIIYDEKGPEVLKTLLTGLPSPTSLFWSLVTFGINMALVLMVWDLINRAPLFYPAHDLTFARVGYVSDSTAKILVREPYAEQYPVFASYRHADAAMRAYSSRPHDTAWKSGGKLAWLDNITDYTGTFTLKGLLPDTRYQYSISNNNTGFFTTAPKTGVTSSRMPSAGVYTFLHSSCIKPNFPYKPFTHALTVPGLRFLAEKIPELHAQFMLFLGDFIYIDVPHRITPSTAETYRAEYRRVYSAPEWQAATRELPWIHVYDDHEVANDWDANTTGVFPAANDPYTHYHTSVNPPLVRQGETYFSFTQGPATFFMLDTRRYRSPNDDTNGTDPVTGEVTKSILGANQLSDLLLWLKRPEAAGIRWKIVVSSIPFTQNWWINAQDTWRGYLGERQMILEAMWDVGLRGGVGVIVISGDRHEFAATAFPPPPDGKEVIQGLGLGLGGSKANQGTLRTQRKRWPLSATVHEFSASPLSMFYMPFGTYSESTTSTEYVSDVCIKYIRDGNSKFGAVTISNPATSEQSILRYRLFVDGEEKWSYTLTTPPDVSGGERSKDAIWG